MHSCTKISVTFVLLVVLISSVSLSAATLKGQWDFDNPANLTQSTVGNALVLHGTNTAVSGIGGSDGAARISEGSYYGCNHLITSAGYGGGRNVNLYSFVMDVKVGMNGWYDWIALYNTTVANTDEADIWVSPADTIGVGSYYSNRPIADDNWYRIVITHSSTSRNSGTLYIYVNGTLVTTMPVTRDGRWSLATDQVLFFADNAGYDHTIDVSKLMVYEGVLTPAEIAALGGPGGQMSPAEPPLMFPWLQDALPDSMTIMWEQRIVAGTPSLVYGTNTNYGSSASYTSVSSGYSTIYKSVLTGLQANTTYHYQLTTADGYVCPDRTFTTAPSTAADFSFGVWGDSQDTYDSTIGPPGDPWEPAKAMMRTMVSQGCKLGVTTGDMEYDGFDYSYTRESFTKRIQQYLGSSIPFYVSWGNHDGDIYAVARQYTSRPNTGCFSFNYAGCHFLCIPVDAAAFADYAWMANDLAANQNAKFTFVFVHKPPYCERWYDGEPTLRDNLVPLMEQYGVDVCFSGHVHEYERGFLNGVYYCITGGGSWLDYPEVLVMDWPHMTVGGYNSVGPGITGGLVNEFVRVNVTGNTLTASMIAFNTDGTIKGTYDTFTKTAGGGDTAAPTPNPMTWASVPAATGSTTVVMTATTGSDATGPVQYFFQNTTTGMSSHNSGWQTGTSWTDTGLAPSTTYSYQVQARDSVTPTPNVGAWSTTAFATTQAGGSTLFSDGFESGNFTAGGWTTQNANATVATTAKYTGTYGAKLASATWMQKAVSTAGLSSIHVKYARKTAGMAGAVYLYAEWSIDGSVWNVLESTQSKSWASQDFTCGSGANNNANFRVRWRTNGTKATQNASVDDVMVTGQ